MIKRAQEAVELGRAKSAPMERSDQKGLPAAFLEAPGSMLGNHEFGLRGRRAIPPRPLSPSTGIWEDRVPQVTPETWVVIPGMAESILERLKAMADSLRA